VHLVHTLGVVVPNARIVIRFRCGIFQNQAVATFRNRLVVRKRSYFFSGSPRNLLVASPFSWEDEDSCFSLTKMRLLE
jgi:hypothetical protein